MSLFPIPCPLARTVRYRCHVMGRSCFSPQFAIHEKQHSTGRRCLSCHSTFSSGEAPRRRTAGTGVTARRKSRPSRASAAWPPPRCQTLTTLVMYRLCASEVASSKGTNDNVLAQWRLVPLQRCSGIGWRRWRRIWRGDRTRTSDENGLSGQGSQSWRKNCSKPRHSAPRGWPPVTKFRD